MTKGLGWIPDIPDVRDFKLSTRGVIKRQEALPEYVDLRPGFPAAYDQGEIGSCTGQAISGAYSYLKAKQLNVSPEFIPSALFIYYNERAIENTIHSDRGASLRTGMKTVNADGVCKVETWPYLIENFAVTPHDQAYIEATDNQALQYERVDRTLYDMRKLLAEGFPFVFGFAVYDSFYSDEVKNTGIMPLPKHDERMLGGHAVVAVGYDDSRQSFIVRNSWGTNWGVDGYFYMPYVYTIDGQLSMDFWVMTLVE